MTEKIAPVYELSKPMNREEYLSKRDENGCVQAIVGVSFETIRTGDYDDFIYSLSESIVSDLGLCFDDYKPIGVDDNENIIFSVTSHVDEFEEGNI